MQAFYIRILRSRAHAPSSLANARGVTLIMTLIALVVLFISAIALIRSMDASQLMAGNLAFKRDLRNQSERAVAAAMATFEVGGLLANTTSRNVDLPQANYSSTALSSDVHGIPSVLFNTSVFDATYSAPDPSSGDAWSADLKIRYVIDRMCNVSGAPTPANCQLNALSTDRGGTAGEKKVGGVSTPVYRVTIRVDGPRNTTTFVQTILQS